MAPQMLTLRYTFAAGATEADVAELTPALVALARSVEQSLVAHPPLA
jgi:hypothetical protein